MSLTVADDGPATLASWPGCAAESAVQVKDRVMNVLCLPGCTGLCVDGRVRDTSPCVYCQYLLNT